MSPKRFRFKTHHNDVDPLGGAVSPDNAAFTMSEHISGPALHHLKVGESQVRQATTADGYVRPGQRIRYDVTREV